MHSEAHGSDRSPRSEVVRQITRKRGSSYGFKRNEFVFPALEAINKAAYWDYQRERVYVKSRFKTKFRPARKTKRRIALKPNTSIESRPSRFACNSKLIYRHGKRSTTRIDLKFMRYGVKRWIARYVIQRYRCRFCLRTFYSPGWRWTGKYGPDLIAYAVYQNIELRIPQSLICYRYKWSNVRTEHQPKHDQQIQIRSGTELQTHVRQTAETSSEAVFCISTKQASASRKETVMSGF